MSRLQIDLMPGHLKGILSDAGDLQVKARMMTQEAERLREIVNVEQRHVKLVHDHEPCDEQGLWCFYADDDEMQDGCLRCGHPSERK